MRCGSWTCASLQWTTSRTCASRLFRLVHAVHIFFVYIPHNASQRIHMILHDRKKEAALQHRWHCERRFVKVPIKNALVESRSIATAFFQNRFECEADECGVFASDERAYTFRICHLRDPNCAHDTQVTSFTKRLLQFRPVLHIASGVISFYDAHCVYLEKKTKEIVPNVNKQIEYSCLSNTRIRVFAPVFIDACVRVCVCAFHLSETSKNDHKNYQKKKIILMIIIIMSNGIDHCSSGDACMLIWRPCPAISA